MSGNPEEKQTTDESTRGSKRRHAFLEDRSISPPPLRRKLPTTPSTAQSEEVNNNRFEIISWNVNGVGPFFSGQTPKITSFSKTRPSASNAKEEPYSLRNFLRRHKFPQILCLQEVKINSKDEATKRALERAANGYDGPSYTAHFSLPRDRFNAKGFGGKVHGVCTLIRDDVLENKGGRAVTRDVDWDLEGRVLITEFGWKLLVVNGYWVNGTTNPYRDSQTGEVTGTRHDWKRKFHSLVLQEVKAYEAKGWHVVLIGDMNIAREPIDGYPGIRLGPDHVKNRSDFNAKFFNEPKGMRGIDTFRHFYGGKRKYSYHGEKAEEWGRSCDRVDLGIVSRSLVEGRGGLVVADIWESVEERGHSDHVPIGVVLDLERLEPPD